jgi:DNA-directed RNA polymerase subunit H (RpoH/RPB5)
MDRHYLQASHRVMDGDEVASLLTSQGIELKQLPAIFLSDPGLRNEGIVVAEGDVLEITRFATDKFPGGTLYRRVVKGW